MKRLYLDDDDEVWRDIPDYESIYQVSTFGRVKSLCRRVGYKGRMNGKLLPERIMKLWNLYRPEYGRSARSYIKLKDRNGKSANWLVSRLVLLTFVGPCPEGMEACHGDDIGTNNHINNLRWDTHVNNCLDRRKNGVNFNSPNLPRGSRHHLAKFTKPIVLWIRKTYAAGELSQGQIAEKLSVSQPSVSAVILRKSWKHV